MRLSAISLLARRVIPTLIFPALALAACGGSTPSADDIDLRSPPVGVTALCARPVAIPDTATTQGRQEALWRRDRLNLAACADRHAAAAAWINDVVAEFGPR